MNSLLGSTVVKDYVKAPGHRNDQLMQLFVGVTTAFSTAGHVVQVVNPTDFKRDVIPTLDESQVAPRIRNLWKLNNLAGVNVEVRRHFWS
jgi:hypothetical protein